jgi:site-specific DNA-methyltransferase (adenine-specific)
MRLPHHRGSGVALSLLSTHEWQMSALIESFGDGGPIEMNQILLGDCLTVLDKLELNTVDLVYLDPPFFTQREQRLVTRDGLKEYSFVDSWNNITEYREYIKLRIKKCRQALRDTGSIFLHCDRSASHHLRLVLDEVFGAENFQSEIIWSYRRWSNAKKGLLNTHQVIFFYSKTNNFKFNQMYDDYSPTTNIDQILQERVRDERGKAAYKTDENGNNVLVKDKKGVPLSDVWQIPYLNPKATERVGYPTQKPIHLLERIILLVTNEGDTVLDPFCGSGTTLVASKLLNRSYIGIDQQNDAVELANQRIANPVKTESALLKNGLDSYKNQDKETSNILREIGAVIVQRNKGIDGFVKTSSGLIPIKIRKMGESFEEAKMHLIRSSLKNNYPRKILLLLDDVIDEPRLFDMSEKDVIDESILICRDIVQLTEAIGLLEREKIRHITDVGRRKNPKRFV